MLWQNDLSFFIQKLVRLKEFQSDYKYYHIFTSENWYKYYQLFLWFHQATQWSIFSQIFNTKTSIEYISTVLRIFSTQKKDYSKKNNELNEKSLQLTICSAMPHHGLFCYLDALQSSHNGLHLFQMQICKTQEEKTLLDLYYTRAKATWCNKIIKQWKCIGVTILEAVNKSRDMHP